MQLGGIGKLRQHLFSFDIRVASYDISVVSSMPPTSSFFFAEFASLPIRTITNQKRRPRNYSFLLAGGQIDIPSNSPTYYSCRWGGRPYEPPRVG